MMPAQILIPDIRIYPKRPDSGLTGEAQHADLKRRFENWKAQTLAERVNGAATPPEDGFEVHCEILMPERPNNVWLDGVFRFQRVYPLGTTLAKVWADIWDEARKEAGS